MEELSKDTMEEEYKKLKQELERCRVCRDKMVHEPQPLIWGSIHSKIVQISQAPSWNVHQTQRPFNDASGKKLREEWYHIPDEIFYNKDCFYLTSIGHCYPGKTPGGADRKPPRKCADLWLHRELQLVQNELYVLIGGCAAQYFFPKHNFSSLVFEDLEINRKPAYVLPHPSPANKKWFLDHPEFLEKRVKIVAERIHQVLRLPGEEDR